MINEWECCDDDAILLANCDATGITFTAFDPERKSIRVVLNDADAKELIATLQTYVATREAAAADLEKQP